MRALANLMVKAADLAEAEGRTFLSVARDEGGKLRLIVNRMALGGFCLLSAAPLLVFGVVLLAYGLGLWLESLIGRPAAAAITGAAVLAAGGLCLWLAKHTAKA